MPCNKRIKTTLQKTKIRKITECSGFLERITQKEEKILKKEKKIKKKSMLNLTIFKKNYHYIFFKRKRQIKIKRYSNSKKKE